MIELFVGPTNGSVKRQVSAIVNGEELHRDVFDTDSAYLRRMFAVAVDERLRRGGRVPTDDDCKNWNPNNGGPGATGLDVEVLADRIRSEADKVDAEKPQGDDSSDGDRIIFERLSSRELADASHETPCIVEEVVPEAQGGVIGGRFKVLKTGIACDLMVSGATGTAFLNHFIVPQAVRCGMMSAEIGARSLKERAAAVAAARGFDLRDLDNAVWSTASPRIGEPKQMEALERFIVDDELAMLVIDPSYLAFSGVGNHAGNVFLMGGFLIEITRLIERTGCAILLVNHNRKGRGQDVGKFDPPELAELAMSGFAEWLRFYLLLGPRQEWDETGGNHWLWLRTGGSAIDSGLWGLDVHEGRRSDPGGRVWEVELSGVTNAKKEQQKQAENRKAEQQERKEAEHQRKLEAALLAFPKGETCKVLRETSGLNGNNFAAAIRALVNSGKAAACTVVKRGQAHDGYQPKT